VYAFFIVLEILCFWQDTVEDFECSSEILDDVLHLLNNKTSTEWVRFTSGPVEAQFPENTVKFSFSVSVRIRFVHVPVIFREMPEIWTVDADT